MSTICDAYGCVDTVRRAGIVRPYRETRYRLMGLCGHCSEKASEEGRTLMDWGSETEAGLAVAVLSEAWLNHIGERGMTVRLIAEDRDMEVHQVSAVKQKLSEAGLVERGRTLKLCISGLDACRLMGMLGEQVEP